MPRSAASCAFSSCAPYRRSRAVWFCGGSLALGMRCVSCLIPMSVRTFSSRCLRVYSSRAFLLRSRSLGGVLPPCTWPCACFLSASTVSCVRCACSFSVSVLCPSLGGSSVPLVLCTRLRLCVCDPVRAGALSARCVPLALPFAFCLAVFRPVFFVLCVPQRVVRGGLASCVFCLWVSSRTCLLPAVCARFAGRSGAAW